MHVPESVLRQVLEALEELSGGPVALLRQSPVGGGCINPSARLDTDRKESFFLKWNAGVSPDLFAAEADGLHALGAPGCLRVPAVIGWGGSGIPADPAWLLLEFVPRGSPARDYGERLGRGLARLHRSAPDEAYGWRRDNFIGSLPQANRPWKSWPAFWREERLAPQIGMARDAGYLRGRASVVLDTVLERMDELLSGADALGPALLHGDLWSGNFYPDPQGEPVLIDPAVYQGVGEVDLAMMELFGSFPRGFRQAYEEITPLDPAYGAFRRDLYQLYYLLVHVNLFGAGYEGAALAAAARALQGG